MTGGGGEMAAAPGTTIAPILTIIKTAQDSADLNLQLNYKQCSVLKKIKFIKIQLTSLQE
jgi:hypothetical protein